MPVKAHAFRIGRDILLQLAIFVAALGLAEAALRAIDLRELRDSYQPGRMLLFQYDADLGWAGIPHATSSFTGSRTIDVRNNSLGLRDIEPDAAARPRVLIIGDSFVWGYDVEADQRFTELLRRELPGAQIVNAGVPGYGTDQEYLLLRRIWSALTPDVVVLVFTTQNDRADNSVSMTDGGYYKPYLVRAADGAWRFAGQPVPVSRQVYFRDNVLVHHLWLARAAVTGFVRLAHPEVAVPDPTEQLVDMMRGFVEAEGAKFVVGLECHEERLETFLRARGILSTAFDGAAAYPTDGSHWTPAGHAVVASRLLSLLAAAGIAAPAAHYR
ncbi:MAG: SGNH/GDSL hydrolase family protein [Acetobacteraceae bacterium]|nr:SGNH/GDSL hydrolase family protein [Acetobacteraceae bacterium]